MGSGWVPAADLLGETVAELPVTDLPGFHAAAVEGHAGTLRSVRVGEAATRWSSSAGRTCTRAGVSRRWSTACAPPSRPARGSSC